MIVLHSSLISEMVRSARYLSYRQLMYGLVHLGYFWVIPIIGFGGWLYFKDKKKRK